MTRRQAIKAYYRWLHNGNRASVRNCSMYGHPLYPYRTGRKRDDEPADGRREPDIRTGADYRFDKPMQPAKAIRATCGDCAETYADVLDCKQVDCPLWPYRTGRGKIAPDRTISKAIKKQADTTSGREQSFHETNQIGLNFNSDDESEKAK